MKPGLTALALSYILSQFFRSFLAVLAPSLEVDIGAAADDLSRASAAFFLTFAAAQIPVGWSLDHFGPRRTATLPFAIFGGGGALFVAFAQSPLAIEIGMGLIGLGVAPILMATYFILLRTYPTAAFATMAGMFVGFGSLGNLFGSIPLAEAVETIGWRAAMQIVAALTVIGAIAIWIFVRDPERIEGQSSKGGFTELLRIRTLWPIILMITVSYAPSISLRGVWMGPYLKDTFALTTRQIGWSTMAMALAMIAALLALGPIDRWLNRKKTLILFCGVLNIILFTALPFIPSLGPAIIMFILIGWFGSIYPLLISHGMGFVPKHLTGRGASLLNLFSIGGVSVLQWLAAKLFNGTYQPVFLMFAGALTIGVIAYSFARLPKPDAIR